MKITVIVCTHNRCESLKDTVRSLQQQNFPASDYEIIVVDNNSTDNTEAIVGGLSSSSAARVEYLFERMLGLSLARNRGVAHAKGEIVAFIDDDAVADATWLLNLTRVYEEEKEAVCVGGRIELEWTIAKPEWWHLSFDNEFGINHGVERKELRYPLFPYGTNISFKKSVLLDYGGFSVHLGRKGSQLLGWEETDVCLQIEKNGGRIYYEPNAIVRHIMSFSRARKPFILKRSFWHGRSHAMLERKHFGEDYIYKKTKRFRKECLNWFLQTKHQFFQFNLICYLLGYQVQVFLISRRKNHG